MNKKEFAILFTQEGLFFDNCDKESSEEYIKSFLDFEKNLRKRELEIDGCFDVILNIKIDSEKDSVYNISDILHVEFKDKVRIDAIPSSFIGIQCNKDDIKSITEYLNKNYQDITIEIDTDVSGHSVNPWFSNWTQAKSYCKENNIEVKLPKSALIK